MVVAQQWRAATAQDAPEAVARTERVKDSVETAVAVGVARVTVIVSGLAEEVPLPPAGGLEREEGETDALGEGAPTREGA